jgi:hypothetical protein
VRTDGWYTPGSQLGLTKEQLQDGAEEYTAQELRNAHECLTEMDIFTLQGHKQINT